MRSRLVLGLSIAALALLAWGMAGCGGSSGGTGTLQLFLTDAPLQADEVNVVISSIQVHTSENGWQTLKTFDPGLEVNLLDYSTAGSQLLLADEPLSAGHYTMIRLMLSSAAVVVGGNSYDVDLSNVEETGVKCNGQFTVSEGQMMALIIDFNAGRSFVETGSHVYKLHPVMTMSPVDVAAAVTGSVEFQDESAVVQPLPENVVLNMYTPDHAGEADYLVASAAVNTDGTFSFSVVPAGTYDIQVLSSDAVVKLMEDVVVTAPSTDLGKIVVVVTP